ncbi:MAG: glucokinase [Pseudomonadota bacterium]
MSATETGKRIVADIGGTNTRLALFDQERGELSQRSSYLNADYGCLEDIVDEWLQQLAGAPPAAACFAIAAPPFDDNIRMTNLDWRFSRSELSTKFAFQPLLCINDFAANAYALTHLAPDDLLSLQTGESSGSTLAVIGPGTGLGGAILQADGGAVRPCEPGHIGLSAGTDLELEILKVLLAQGGKLHAETLLSGPGIVRLYQTLAAIRGEEAGDLSPIEISAMAQGGEDELSVQAVTTFCALLGSTCGDFVLASGAYGGLFLAGDILSGMGGFLESSPFLGRFSQKGDMRPHLSQVPVHLITNTAPGLLGAGYAPLSP